MVHAGVVSGDYINASTPAVVRIMRTAIVDLAQRMSDDSITDAVQHLTTSALAAHRAGQVSSMTFCAIGSIKRFSCLLLGAMPGLMTTTKGRQDAT